MPRAPVERPSRRLDAILDALRRHGVEEFEAGKLEGIGEGLKFRFGPLLGVPAQRQQQERPARHDPDLDPEARDERQPVDELSLVVAGRDGPVPDSNGVS